MVLAMFRCDRKRTFVVHLPAIMHLVLFVILLRLNYAWYDTTTSVQDLFSLENSTLSKHHNPKEGTLVMRKRSRTDSEVIDMINTVRTRQSTKEEQAKRNKMKMNPPIIGHMSPNGGPISGGTTVKFWGTNFAGGSLYKCLFGKYVDGSVTLRATAEKQYDKLSTVVGKQWLLMEECI